jgi:hypothetical protein
MSTSQSIINGIFVPNIVPYDTKGRIDEDELRHIIRWVGDKGVTGFYPNGSMGEFIRLSYEERRTVVRIVSEEANGRPILAGAAEANIELVLEMCKYCADLGCRAVSITSPYYYILTQESIEAYFPEGFRTGYELRGFKAGNARFPLSPAEQGLIAEMRSKLACVLAGCGFSEAAGECRISSAQAFDAAQRHRPDRIR